MKNIIFKIISLYQFFRLLSDFKNNGYSQIRLYKFSSWHHGVGYLLAQNSTGATYFIKSSGTYDAAKCEYDCLKKMHLTAPSVVPQVINYIKKKEFSIVVMEAVEGEFITANNTTIDEYITFCHEVSYALNTCQIIHRDINEYNILKGKDGRLVLIDFGWALNEKNRSRDVGHEDSLKTLGGEFQLAPMSWQDSHALKSLGRKLFGKKFDLDIETNIYSYDSKGLN